MTSLLLALAWVPLTACAEPARIVIELDPRIELYSVVKMLAYPQTGLLVGDAGQSYLKAARDSFAPMAGHPAVTRLRRVLDAGAQEYSLTNLMLRVSPPPALSLKGVEEDVFYVLGSRSELEPFMAELRDFYTRSRFDRFLRSQRQAQRDFVAEAGRESARALTPESMAAYLGDYSVSRYRVVLAPLADSALANRVTLPDESVTVRPVKYWRDGQSFSLAGIGTSIAHDVVHSMTSPLVLSSAGALAAIENTKDCPGNRPNCLDEDLVMAISLRVLRKTAGDAAYRAELGAWEARGFKHLGPLCEELETYESGRARYRTLADFYPALLAAYLKLVR